VDEDRDLYPVGCAEFGEQSGHVGLHGGLAQVQLGGDVGIGAAGCNRDGYLALTVGQGGQPGGGRGASIVDGSAGHAPPFNVALHPKITFQVDFSNQERIRVFAPPTLTVSKAGFTTINGRLLEDTEDIWFHHDHWARRARQRHHASARSSSRSVRQPRSPGAAGELLDMGPGFS
jgi:hypothetical protein